ncbi:MAG: hypothetical protein FJZ38_15710 [Candidatus Rokubacteria bacterium]|nr:hypothetical protein [Candidatus Rokubacteria bacterium]
MRVTAIYARESTDEAGTRFQAVRPPAQRRTAQEMIAHIGRINAIGRAMDADAWRYRFAQLKADGVVAAESDADEIRDFILDGEYDMIADEQYAMLLSLGRADDLV